MIQSLYEPFKHWSEDGAVYIIADPHFGDPDCQVMNPEWPEPEYAIKMINSVVTKNDTLVILGDVGDEEYVSFLHAKYKVLICGNHDKGESRYVGGFNVAWFDAEKFTYDDAMRIATEKFPLGNIEITKKYAPAPDSFYYYEVVVDNGLFNEIYTGPLMVGEKLLLSHEPISLPFVTNIHGHVHGAEMRYKNEFGCNCLNVASDVCGYKPINLGVEIKNGLMADTPSIHRLAIDKKI